MEPTQPTKTGFSTSEFWVNGGAGATIVVLVEKAIGAISASPETAMPLAAAAASGCLALAGIGLGYAMLRTKAKGAAEKPQGASQ